MEQYKSLNRIFVIGLFLALISRDVLGQGNCLNYWTGQEWDSNGVVTFTYITCDTCATNKYRFKNGTVIFLSDPVDTYDCALCDSNCLTCQTSPTNCLTCFQGQYIAQDKSCKLCDSSFVHCTQCTINGCDHCTATYKPYNGQCIYDCVPNFGARCLTCPGGITCESCQPGYVFDTGQSCVPCSLANCQTCQDGPICSTCQPNFYLDIPNGNLSCSACSIANCQTCTHGPKCANCLPNFYLFLPQNLSCLPCSTISDCEICVDGPECVKCPTNYILSALSPNNSCIKCPFGHYSSSTNQCLPCPSNCIMCQEMAEGIDCVPCPINTVLDLNVQDCLRCDTSIKKCQLCSSIDVCTKCYYPYLLGDINHCDRCEPGFQYVEEHCIKPTGCRALLPDFSKCLACAADSYFMYESLGNTCKCFNGRYPSYLQGINVCLPKCGDGILIFPDEQCDDANLRNQDGCNQKCQLEPYFKCSNENPSKCTLQFTPKLFQYNYAYRYEGENRCRFSLTLSPSHPGLKYVNWSSYLAFNISDQDIGKNSKTYSYNEITNQIMIEIEYLRTLENMTVEFRLFSALPLVQGLQYALSVPASHFIQSGEEQILSQTTSSVSSPKSSSAYIYLQLKSQIGLVVVLSGQNGKLLYEKQFIFVVFQSIQITSLIISVLILLQFFIASYFHKMIGLETIQILQFFYFVRLIIEQNFTILLQSMNVFKYTAYGGYSDFDLFVDQASQTYIPLTYKSVGQNFVAVELTKYFFTNVNIPLILPSISLIVFLLTLARKYSKRSEYLKKRDILLKDQYTTFRRSSIWVYEHFVFPYLNIFNMAIFFTTIMYLKFKPNTLIDELQGTAVIKTIEKINYPVHLTMAFLVFMIYCSQIFQSLEQFRKSRMSESERARVPKSTYEKIEHDQNNPDRQNYKPGYTLFYLFFYLSVEVSLMVDILFDSSFNFGVEILLGISVLYLIFVWTWKPYNGAVQFHNKALRLNHFSIVFFLFANAIMRRVQISMTVYLILVYTTIVLLLVVTLCGYIRIVVEHRFRKRLLQQPDLMKSYQYDKKGSARLKNQQEASKKKNLLKMNPYLFENQVKQMLMKEGRTNISELTQKDINNAKQKMVQLINLDKQRMESIKRQRYFLSEQPFVINELVARHLEHQIIMAPNFKRQDIRSKRKKNTNTGQ